MKRFLKIIAYFILTIIFLLVITLWLLTKEKYQNILVQKATVYLSEKLNTTVAIKKVNFSFFNNFNIQGVYIEDDKKDTLAYIGNIQLKTSELLSNYWNKETFEISEVGIENAYVHLYRSKDSIWNYDFIEKALSGQKETSSKKNVEEKKEIATANQKGQPTFDLKKVALKNIQFYMDDAWVGEDMRFEVLDLNLDVNKIAIENKKIAIREFVLNEANVAVKEYVGFRPKRIKIIDSTEWGTPFNPDLFDISCDKIQINNTTFSFDDGNRKPNPKEFNESHLHVSNINLTIANTKIIADTIFSEIKNFTAKERCGLAIQSLKGNLKFSQVQTVLYDMQLKTDYSTISDYYEMQYANFHDFNNFIEKVRMISTLKKSSISSLDIGYFANILNEYPIAINLSGEINGTVANLKAKNIQLKTLNTSFEGNANVVGLPDIEKTIFEVQAKQLQTSGSDLNKLIPQTKTDEVAWADLKNIQFKGTYKGKVDEFNTKGNLTTTLGNAIVDLNMNFKPKNPTYSGAFETDNLQLGKLIKQNSIGLLSMKGTVEGKGFDMNTLDAKVNAIIKRIDAEGATYKDLTINGLISNKKFDGIFVSQDEKLALNFNGKLDLSGTKPVYNFNSRFISVNLQKLGITDEPITASGLATLNFTGDNIDNFTGSALLKNISIQSEKHFIKADEILLESFQINKQKTLKLTSSIADAELTGQYKISELGSAFQMYLHHYLPDYIKKPKSQPAQSFEFNANIKNVDNILLTFIPSLKGINGTIVEGELNTATQKLTLDANIPSVGYDDLLIKDIVFVGGGDYNSLEVNATTKNLLYNNEVVIPSMQINSNMASDTASLSINTQSINDLLGDASINCKATAFNGNLYVDLLPSKFSLKDDSWQFYSAENIVLGEYIQVKDLILENGAQRIAINSRNTNVNNLNIAINNIDLESVSKYSGSDVDLFGRFDGTIDIENYTKSPLINATVFSTKDVIIDEDTVGKIQLSANYNVDKQLLTINNSTSINRNGNFANVEGYLNTKDSVVNIKTSLSNQSISFLNKFLSDYIQNLKGDATGKVLVEGKLANPTITGNVDLVNASLKVLFLGTTYSIDEAKMKFNNRRIEMQNFYLKDERVGNYKGYLKGYITHNNFSDFFLNFNIKSDNLLCLNTQDSGEELFYGYVPAKVNVDLTGPLEDIYVDMAVKPLKGSQFHLPINSSGDASTYDYIQFKEIGRLQNEKETKKRSSSYVKLNMKIEATPDAEAFIILDANTGEQIVAKGNGDIRLIVDLGNSIEMYGSYGITEGKYLFNFRGLFNKEFTIEDGSKITWNGDALNANMDIKAVYKLPQSKALFPLISNIPDLAEEEKTEAKRLYPTFVTIHLLNSLSKPDFKFDITQPENKSVGSIAYTKLEQLKNDEKEILAQAGVLLLFNEFKASDGIANSTYSAGAVSTVSEVVTSALSNEITNQLQKMLGTNKLVFNVDYQNSNNQALLNAANNEFSVNVTANILKDRVILDFGNTVDVGRDANGNRTNNLFAGNFKAQILLTEDGRLRLNTYATNNDANIDGNNIIKGGAGLSYRKVFNSLNELMMSKKKKEKKKTTTNT